MDDQALVQGCLKNDRRSQNDLYRKYFALMSSIAYRYTNDQQTALQRMNGAFMKVLQNLDSYNSRYALGSWMRKVVVNHMIDEYRKERSYISNVHLTDFVDMESGVSYNQGAQQLEANELRELLYQLPDVTQKVFNLYAIDGYKHREIAEKLGISEGTSKWHVSHARARLKDLIEALYQDQKKVAEAVK